MTIVHIILSEVSRSLSLSFTKKLFRLTLCPINYRSLFDVALFHLNPGDYILHFPALYYGVFNTQLINHNNRVIFYESALEAC